MANGTILDTILAHKRIEVARHRMEAPLSALEEQIASADFPLNLSGALWGDQIRLIAETKKASPSRGVLVPNYDPVALAICYAENGAAAISVLTEATHFQGSLEHLQAVKQAMAPLGLPVLRKDFLYDPYQLYEARAWGADAVLLIVAMLEESRLQEMLGVCQELWLQALVEVHDAADLEIALAVGAEIIGVNHRDLRTFTVNTSLTAQLRPQIPSGKMVVAESGIFTASDVAELKQARVNAVLVGEALMTSPDIGAKVRELTGV